MANDINSNCIYISYDRRLNEKDTQHSKIKKKIIKTNHNYFTMKQIFFFCLYPINISYMCGFVGQIRSVYLCLFGR